MKLSEQQIEDIIELENKIYLPILLASGIVPQNENKRKKLAEDQEIILQYNSNKQLVNIFRYKINSDTAFVLSLILDTETIPLRFLRKILISLHKNKIKTIESVVQIANKKSILFHEKLGFEILEKYQKAIRYSIAFEQINTKFF